MKGLLAVLLSLPAAAAERSTAAARPGDNPWAMEFRHDERGQSVRLGYRIRWEPGDLVSRPRETMQRPVRTFAESLTDILQSSRLSFYGVHLKPFRRHETPADFAVDASSAPAPAPAPAAARRRALTLNLDRSIRDLRFSAEREAQRWLVREAFDQSLPDARGAPYWQKEAAVRSLEDAAGSWRED